MARKKLVMGEAWANTPTDPVETPPVETAPAEPAPPQEPGVKIMLLCKSVFLPKGDLLRADWATAATAKYQGEQDGRRVRLTVHPTLAAFLQERKQAETLDG